MAFTLNDMMVGAYRRSGLLNVSRLTVAMATASEVSTGFRDDSLIAETSDDDFNAGTFFMIKSATSTAMEGQFRTISDYIASSGEFVLDSVITGSTAMSSGATYGYTTPELGRDLMVELANDALKSVGDLTFIDKNTLISSAATLEYQMEVPWKRSKPYQIDLQTRIESTALRNAWQPITDYDYEPASAGSTSGRIIFDKYLPVGRKLRVWYKDTHAKITNSSSPVDERIHPELGISLLVERMYEYRNSLTRGAVPWDVQRWNDAKITAQQMRLTYPIWSKKRRSKRLELDGAEPRDHLPYPYPYGPGP